MNANKQAGAEATREAYWIDGIVLFVGSTIAIVAACLFIAVGVSADAVSEAMVWLSCPWFLALYFVSWKLRKVQITSPRRGEVGSHR